jgi:hypothetical protein
MKRLALFGRALPTTELLYWSNSKEEEKYYNFMNFSINIKEIEF